MRFVRSRLSFEALEPRDTPAIFTVTSTDIEGPGTLSRAILDANANPGADEIRFNISGDGVHTIPLIRFNPDQTASVTPRVTDAVTIDGYSQPGSQPNTIAVGGINAAPRIQLVGAAPETSAGRSLVGGLEISANNSIVRGLIVTGCSEGIALRGSNSRVEGCFLGIGAEGSAAPNLYGVAVGIFGGQGAAASGNVIGGMTPQSRNLITGNLAGGATIYGNALGTVIQGNLVGTDASGTDEVQRGTTGIWIQGGLNTVIGGTTSAARNLISGNGIGVILDDASTGTVIQGNYIGTDVTGTAALPNRSGINLAGSSQGAIVGGPDAGEGNVISGNEEDGLLISSSGSGNHTVQGNFIGAAADGYSPLGNGRNGIFIFGTNNNVIGKTNPSGSNVFNGQNIIVFNGANGVLIADAGGASGGDGNNLDSNIIYGSGQRGIALGLGANRNQAAPVLTSAIVQGATATISGSLQGTPNTLFRIEFFANSRLTPLGFAEGERSLGFLMVATNAAGRADFTVTMFPRPVSIAVTAGATGASRTDSSMNHILGVGVGEWITAHATSPTGDTSAYSLAVRASPPAPLVPPISPPPAYTDARVVGNVLIVTGSAVPGGIAILLVPPGSVALMADLTGDGVAELNLFTPDLAISINGQTGQTFAIATDINGDGFRELQVFNTDGTSTFTYGRTGTKM